MIDKNKFIICIGAQKAGTTWLWEHAVKSKKIKCSSTKEIGFFNYVYEPNRYKWIDEKYLNLNLNRDAVNIPNYFELYLSKFDINTESNFYFDATPEYFDLPEFAIKDIREKFNNIDIVILLRNPVERCLSHIKMIIKNDRDGKYNPKECFSFIEDSNIIERSMYERMITKWQQYFGENLRIFMYEQLSEDPQNLLCKIFDGLEDYVVINKDNLFYKFNESTQYDLPIELNDLLKHKLKYTIEWCKTQYPNKWVTHW